MKGSTLPINTIIIVAIAVLVLLVIGGFFSLNVGEGINTIELNGAISKACSVLTTTYNCDSSKLNQATANFREPGKSESSSVPLGGTSDIPKTSLCGYAGLTDITQCLVRCGCAPIGETTSSTTPLEGSTTSTTTGSTTTTTNGLDTDL
jgi:hypothetical protein